MSDHALRIWLRANAIIAQIEAMKAENAYRVSNGYSVAYGEDAFNACANELQQLSQEV